MSLSVKYTSKLFREDVKEFFNNPESKYYREYRDTTARVQAANKYADDVNLIGLAIVSAPVVAPMGVAAIAVTGLMSAGGFLSAQVMKDGHKKDFLKGNLPENVEKRYSEQAYKKVDSFMVSITQMLNDTSKIKSALSSIKDDGYLANRIKANVRKFTMPSEKLDQKSRGMSPS